MTNIVIVGGGFGGLGAALQLGKKFHSDKNVLLTLIDKRDYHLFTPNLFEAATSEEELVSINQIKKSITVPFWEILRGKRIKFVKGNLNSIDAQKKQLAVNNKQVDYDYLILALGSQSDILSVEGAKEHALVLKDLPDALRLRNKLEFDVQAHRLDANKKVIRLVVAGGGYTGLELAGELKYLADYLAWKNQYPREKIEIEVIEATSKLVAGFDDRFSADAFDRLQDLNIRCRLSSRISKVERNLIELMGGEKVAYDVLVWTAGIKACPVPIAPPVAPDRKGRLPVNEYFQVSGYHNIFALGDTACVLNAKKQPVASCAQQAQDQAKYLAYALPFLIKNKKPSRPYVPAPHGFIVNMGGKWTIMCSKSFYIKGFLAYFIDKVANFNYYRSIVGFWKALRYIVFQMEIYGRND